MPYLVSLQYSTPLVNSNLGLAETAARYPPQGGPSHHRMSHGRVIGGVDCPRSIFDVCRDLYGRGWIGGVTSTANANLAPVSTSAERIRDCRPDFFFSAGQV